MTEFSNLIQGLEPAVYERYKQGFYMESPELVSLAISMKRIADALEKAPVLGLAPKEDS